MTTYLTREPIGEFEERWQKTADQPMQFGTLGQRTGTDLIDQIDQAEQEQRDLLVLELVRLSQDGHRHAHELLLKALLPKIVRLSRLLMARHQLSRIDASATVLAATWIAIRDHNTATSRRSVIGSIGLTTLRTLHRSGCHDEELLTSEPQQHLRQEAHDTSADEARVQLRDILNRAVRGRVLTETEVRVLWVGTVGSPQDREHLAAELGIKPDSVQRTASRLRARVRGTFADAA